jgi:hypothetical protein
LVGGIALILVGTILTSMLQQYFAGEYTGAGIIRSRWWWEIVLNLQILSVAFMWFCYVDRINDSHGPKKLVMRLRMFFGLAVILVPTWLALLSVYLDWFSVRPPLLAIDLLLCGMLGVWGLAIFIPRLLILKARPEGYADATFVSLLKPAHWYSLFPVYLLVGVLVLGISRSSEFQYQFIPLLLYAQAAMPYLESAVSWRKATD